MRAVERLLVEARRLIAQGWTQGTYARDRDGLGINYEQEFAVSFCTFGAIYRAREDAKVRADGMILEVVIKQLVDCLPGRSRDLVAFNDYPDRTQDEVLELFDCAIKQA